MKNDDPEPTGAICFDLPSPYEPHPCGLLHLPRFIAKIRKHLAGELPESYRKNFRRGFDRFLCLHLGINPDDVVRVVRGTRPEDLDPELNQLLPDNPNVPAWNREITHKGQTEAGREFLLESLTRMGHPGRIHDIVCICDLIDFDEGRIPGFSDQRRKEWEKSKM